MRKFTFSFKSLLLLTILVLGSASAWAYTPTLTDALEVAGYKKKAYYDISNTNVNEMCNTTADLRFRGTGYGFFNYRAGNGSGDIALPFAEDDIVIFEFKDSQGRSVTINSVANCSLNSTLSTSTGFLVYKATADAGDNTSINVGRGGCIIAILVMEPDDAVETADYTINYKEGGDIVKTVSGTDVAVGTIIPIESSFFESDVKYIKNGGEPSSYTVVSGTNVQDIAVSAASIYSYTVNAKAGESILKVLASGSTYQGENVKVGYPRYFNVGGTLYEKGATSNEYRADVAITEDDQVTDLTYTASAINNVVYYSEGEEVTGATATSEGNNMKTRSSNAQCGYAVSNLDITTLPAGTYTMTVVVYSNSSGGATMSFQIGDEAWNASVAGASNWSQQNKEFTLTETTTIQWLTSGDTKNGLDLVYIVKTGDYEVPLNSTAELQGYKTFYNASNNFQVDANTTIYKAAATVGTVTLTSIEDDIIPAGTPVILKTTDAGYKMTLTATTDDNTTGDYTGNALLVSNGTESNKYILAYTTAQGFGFYQYTSTLESGDIYLDIPAGAKMLRVVVDGQATGIEAPAVAEAENDGVLYNTAGQQVTADYKGIVIKNGKKFYNK